MSQWFSHLRTNVRQIFVGGLALVVGASLISVSPTATAQTNSSATSPAVVDGWEPIAPYDPAKIPDQRPKVRPEPLLAAQEPQFLARMPEQQPLSSAAEAIEFPEPGTAVVRSADLLATSNAAPGELVRAGDLPVLVSRRSSADSTDVTVSLLSQRDPAGSALGAVVFSIDGLGASDVVGLDYSAFAQARGASFGGRLQLVAYPSCALTSPTDPLCRNQTRLDSVNDPATKNVTAVLSPAALASVSEEADGPPAAPSDFGSVVIAALAGSASSEGDFTTSSLAPSGSWTTTGSSGGFGWSYQISAPPPGTGPAPSVGLSYNSQAVDGRVASTNNQSSWLGQGWDYATGFIERTYRTCDEMPGVPADGHTGDMCWAGQVMTMSLGGATTALVQDEDSGEWHPQNDNGERVERLTGASNGALDGEYWKVTATDGTQYVFGRHLAPGASMANATNSVFTMPVFGAKPGEPCYKAESFAQSSCVQGWRWNLDYIQDPHGNAMVNYFVAEKNYYGRNEGVSSVAYIRSGYLSRIDYGLHLANGSVYGAPAPQKFTFNVKERCLPTAQMLCKASDFTAANANRWPDTPFDLLCPSGEPCKVHSPTFWTTKQLSNVVAAYYDPTTAKYTNVDEYRLTQTFHAGLEGGQMTLDNIVRVGYLPDGTSIALPAVKFLNTAMDNRVAGLNDEPAMPFYRLTKITSETGSTIAISYGQPPRSDGGSATKCVAATVPANLAANKMLCFPVKWTLPYQDEPTLDFFHKYVLTQILVADKNGLTPTQKTAFSYVGAPAWHLDDNEVVAPADRSHGQFRGYSAVETRGGDSGNASNGIADKVTLTRTSYLRGLGGSIQNSLGESVPDPDSAAGSVHESQVFDGAVQLSTAVTGFSVIATTATRPRTGLPDLTAKITRAAKSRTITSLVAGGSRSVQTESSFDPQGRLVAQSETGDDVPAVCTSYSYAENLTSWIRDRPAEEIVSAQACPQPVDEPSPVKTLSRTFYDGSEVAGQISGPGDPTLVKTAIEPDGDDYLFARSRFVFDDFGRTVSTTAFSSAQDVVGRTTKTAYTPAGVGAVTQLVSTNALGQQSTSKTTAGRGLTWSSTDVAGSLTEAFYDGLGRTVKVYGPGQARASGDSASQTFSYVLNTNGPSSVTTKTLVDSITAKSYSVSTDLYDGLGQEIQTQSDAEDQRNEYGDSTGNNRVVSDTEYDSHGWAVGSNNGWYTSGPPATALVATSPASINNRMLTFFDAAGRQTKTKNYRGLTEISSSTTSYGGDRTTVVPVAGGTTTTRVTDARGNVTAVREYRTAPVIAGNQVTGGTYWQTSYSYETLGQLKTMTDAAGAVWSYGYDLVGRQISQDDPDAGASSSSYNDTGEVVSTTDARGVTLNYGHDKLGRKISEKSGSTTLASWTWDTLRKGSLTSSTRFTAGHGYTIAALGYDKQGNPLGRKVTIPVAEGQLAGTYTHQNTWTTTGLLDLETVPAAHGLSDEVIDHAYTRLGRPTGLSGDNAYAIDTVYTPFGEVNQIALGVNTHRGWLTVNRFDHSRRVSDIALDIQTGTPRVESISYLYDGYGNVTRSIDTQGGTDEAPIQTTCFDHDTLGRLRQAWSSSNNCGTTPTPSGYATVKGAQSFWTTWDFDSVGNRTKQVNRPTAGKPGNTVANYEYESAEHKHALTKATSTDPADAVTVGSYEYNESGSLAARTQPGKNLAVTYWDDGRTNTITSPSGVTQYIYDADGNILVRRDPGGVKTVFDGDDQYRYADGATSGTRLYKYAGYTIAERVSGKPFSFLFNDINGTPLASAQAAVQGFAGISRRHFDPYGKNLGSASGTWPDRNKFLGLPSNVPELVDMGARLYDPTLGRFLAVDPILTPYDPRQNNGYNYGWNNPLSNPDPGGTEPRPGHRQGPGGCQWGQLNCFNTDLSDHSSPIDALDGIYKNIGLSGCGYGGSTGKCLADIGLFAATGFAAGRLIKGIGEIVGGLAAKIAANSVSKAAAQVSDSRSLTTGANLISAHAGAATARGVRMAANKAGGDAARDAIATQIPGSLIEQSFSTPLGTRVVDVFTPAGRAIESKLGRTSLTADVRAQIAKDEYLAGQGKYPGGVEWMFTKSGVTNRVGPTQPVIDALNKAGITWSEVP